MSEYSCPKMARLGITGVPADSLQKPFTSSKLVGEVNAALRKSGLAGA